MFNRDAEQAERWMAKKETFLQSEEMKLGTSLDTVEVLLKKHDEFDKTLQAQVSRKRKREIVGENEKERRGREGETEK